MFPTLLVQIAEEDSVPCIEDSDYEEFEEQVFRDLEEYRRRKGEDPAEDAEFVIKYRRLEEATVMCHGCWEGNVLRREVSRKADDEWTKTLTNLPKFANSCMIGTTSISRNAVRIILHLLMKQP